MAKSLTKATDRQELAVAHRATIEVLEQTVTALGSPPKGRSRPAMRPAPTAPVASSSRLSPPRKSPLAS